jgi:hypothetical protein
MGATIQHHSRTTTTKQMSLFELGSADRRWQALPEARKHELRCLFAQLFQTHEKRCALDESKSKREVEGE